MQELITRYINVSNPSATGWYSVKCQCCNDYKVRGGFNIRDDSVVYHCFNCNTTASYFNNGVVSDSMREVLQAFNVPLDEIQRISLKNLGKSSKVIEKKIIDTNPVFEITLPKTFYKIILDGSDPWSNVAIDYLEHDRGITDYKMFYLSQGNTTEVEKKWYGRLIIPFYRDNKLIFYQGRSLNESTRRYINSTVSNDAVILYNYKELTRNVDDPLFITEGFFDAYHLNGVAINGNELSPKKITVINQSRRRKIYIPDRYGNGKQAAFNAIEAGWDIAIPDIGDCKDINQAVVRFGLLYVYKSLMCNIKSGFNAKVAVNTLCK
jgi:hypothetical protein